MRNLLRTFLVLFISLTLIPIVSIPAQASAAGWQIQMLVTGKKAALSGARQTNLGSPGTSTFPSITAASTSASSKSTLGSGEGLYSAFFNQSGITKIALVDGTGSSLDPTTHTNYLVYDLVESTGSESIATILKRLDEYQRTASAFHNNDTVWGANSVLNHTAGYSGTLSSYGGTAFKTNTAGMTSGSQYPDRFALMGINRDSDNDIQALAAYWGNLSTTSGKGDAWRNQDPTQTFWSYWGHDFHANSQTQRIGASLQTSPGVATGASWTGDVYLLAFTPNTDSTAPTITGPSSATGASSSISITENSTAVHTFTANESVTWSRSGTDSSFFAITSAGGVLTITARDFESPVDNESNNTYVVTITATDTAGNATNQTLTVTITNVNEAPTITTASSDPTHTISQAENTSSVVTYTGSDVDAGTTLTWSISGTDAADFSINSSSGALAFSINPDFEAPADADTNNAYTVIVTLSDGSLTDTQTVTITITNANESAIINAPTVSGSINKGINTTITVTINVAGKVRFFVGNKRISTCKERTTSGTYPNNSATCTWKPAVTGRQFLTATLTPTDNSFSASTSAPTEVFVVRRGTTR
jgi:VCBS repeat-containing protein